MSSGSRWGMDGGLGAAVAGEAGGVCGRRRIQGRKGMRRQESPCQPGPFFPNSCGCFLWIFAQPDPSLGLLPACLGPGRAWASCRASGMTCRREAWDKRGCSGDPLLSSAEAPRFPFLQSDVASADLLRVSQSVDNCLWDQMWVVGWMGLLMWTSDHWQVGRERSG